MNTSEVLPVSPKLTVEIEGMLEIMAQEEYFRKEGYVQFKAIQAIEEGLIDSLGQFEEGLREAQSDIYLIAVPIYTVPEDTRDRIHCPWNSNARPAYFMAIEMGGAEAAEQSLTALKITEEENRINLSKAGIFCTSPR